MPHLLGGQPVLLQKALTWGIDIAGGTDIDLLGAGLYGGIGWQLNGQPVAGFLFCFGSEQWKAQIAILYGSATSNQIKSRTYNNGWTAWKDL